jgi:hypothetical protein
MALSKIDADGVTGLQETLTATTTVPSEGGAVTTNLVQGVAKHWANWDGTGTVAFRDSLNASSLEDGGSGLYRPVMTNPMTAANYSIGKSASNYCFSTSSTSYSDTTTKFYNYVQNSSGTFVDAEGVYSQAFGDLA